MAHSAISFGIVMIILGVVGYLVTGMESVTALIPSFFGAVITGCGFLAKKSGGLTKPLTIVVLVLCVLGVLGPAGRIVPSIFNGNFEFGIPVIMQLIFVVLAVMLGLLMVKAVKSK